MKNLTTSLFFLLLALAGQLASAQTIRRVNNTGVTGLNIYSTLTAAYAAAVAGDIIQVEGSESSYGSITVDKNVTIVGPGYFTDPTENAGLQVKPLDATLSQISIVAGGEGAYIAGLVVNAYLVSASNVTVQRCKISTLYANYTCGAGGAAPLTNVRIINNYITSSIADACGGVASVGNMYIANNIMSSVSLPNTYNGAFANNVVTSNCTLSNFFITNNYSPYYAGTTNTYNNNICSGNYLPTGNGNQNNVAQSSVFVLAPGTTQFDAWYQLKTGTNPAQGAGVGGVDIGAFGGTAPYKLGGLPNIPAIYHQTQTIVGTSVNVNLSTRSNN